LGFAFFGDLHYIFPLDKHLATAHHLLHLFPHDAIAARNANIIGYLREACDAYLEKRTGQDMDYQNLSVRSMFGQVHDMRTQTSTRSHTPFQGSSANQATDDNATVLDVPEPSVQNMVGNPDIYELNDVSTSMNYPLMTPRTLWFDSFDETLPLFSTISNADEYYTSFHAMGVDASFANSVGFAVPTSSTERPL
jgi:hypothetical protein